VTNMIELVLADDHRVFAEGLGLMLDAQDDLAVLGVAHDHDQAIGLAARHQPTVLLLDAHMPGAEMATTLRGVKAVSPDTKVLMLSADTRRETITAAIDSGADGFLAKEASSREVAAAIRKLVDGQRGVVVAAEPARAPTRDPSVDLRVRTLSGREREILGLLANGWSNRRIAEECYLSLNTVRTHVQNILIKLGVHSKLEAVAFALEHGWAPAAEDPDELAIEQLEGSRVVAALRELSADQREVLLLRMAGGLTAPEVATILGKTTGAVKALQHRGLASMGRVLGLRSPDQAQERPYDPDHLASQENQQG
jgi:DNA-binding NarL/FixJ family response regulator